MVNFEILLPTTNYYRSDKEAQLEEPHQTYTRKPSDLLLTRKPINKRLTPLTPPIVFSIY